MASEFALALTKPGLQDLAGITKSFSRERQNSMSIKSAALLATTATLAFSSAPLAPRDFRIDAGHSDVSFSIGFLGRTVKGRFDNAGDDCLRSSF